jgi:hypothetical protein
MSLDSYTTLGFDHVQVPRLLLAKYPKGYTPLQLWEWWLNDVSNLAPDQFDVILVDPITDLERGLVDWVSNNPTHFGHTAGQYAKMSGIMWGDVKDYWKLLLTGRVATKCQTFAFVSHMGEVFDKASNKPTGERKAKGKDTLEEIASLYLQMERKKDRAGNRPAVPSAIVLKSRLSHIKMTENGPDIRPALPPRLPVATPAAIRQYMLAPPDYSNLAVEERAPDRVMTDDERLKLQVQKAEAERDLAMMRQAGGATAAPAKEVVESAPVAATKEVVETSANGTAKEHDVSTDATLYQFNMAVLDLKSVDEAKSLAEKIKVAMRGGQFAADNPIAKELQNTFAEKVRELKSLESKSA